MSFSFRKLFISMSIFCLSLALFWGPGHSEEAAAQGSGFNFSVSDLAGHSNAAPSSLQFGPDDKLYVADRFGEIFVYEIVRNGPDDYEVISTEIITSVANMPNHDDDGTLNTSSGLVGFRQVTGLLVTGTATNPVLYVSSSDPRINDPGDTLPLDTNSGVVSRITQTTSGTWAGSQHIDLIRGLPRNLENHSVNGMEISPDGNTLYLAIAGLTNMGAPSFNFGFQWEYAWSAAIAAIDLPAIDLLPTLTDPQSGYLYKYIMPTLDDPSRANSAPGIDVGDPWGGNSDNHGANQAIIQPGMPISLHAVGFRNPYDIVIREDGRMFTIDNGPNSGWGGPPANEGPAGNCLNTVNNGGSTINDNLHYVRELAPGEPYYAGHPNPLRGNPTDIYSSTLGLPVPFSAPPVPFSMANPVECDYRNPELGEDGSLENWPFSTNGITEYSATNFGGALQGAILAAGWDSANLVRVSMTFDVNDNPTVTASDVLFTTGGAALDVTAQGDTDPFPGTIWVANLYSLGATDVIRIYEPGDFLACNGGPGDDDDGDGYTNQDEIDNGSDFCSSASIPPDNDGDFTSDLNDPDDDNDTILDINDTFAIDEDNGKTTNLPSDFLFDFAEPGLIGSPFTGLMINGSTDYLTQYDPGNMTVIGAAGVFTIDAMPSGDALGAQNDQQYAFQFGANTCDVCYPFIAYTAMSAPLQNITTTITTENMGFYIGSGDQANYLKVVVSGGAGGAGAVDVVLETGDVVQSNVSYPLPAILAGSFIELFLQVDPLALTAQPAYAIDNGPMTDLGPAITIPASWLAAPNALAVGTIGTAGPTGTNFTATWVEIGIHPTTLAGTGSWVTLPSTVPNVRHEDAYIEHNGLFYLFGGRGAGTVNIYNPVTDSWSVGAAPPIEMHHMQPVVYDGLIYVLGAMTGPYPNEVPVTHVYIYDPINDNWYQGMEIPVGRRRGGGALAVYNDKIYFVGGIQNGHVSGTVGWLDEFDPRTNSWTALPDDMPNARDHVHGVVYGDLLYVVGGRVTTQPNFAAGTVPEVDVYDFILGSWTTLPNDLPTPRAAASLAVLGNELLVIGGESDVQSQAHSEVEALNLVDETWRALASLPAGEDRHGTQAVVYGGYAYLAAGSGAQGGSPELSSQVRFGFGTCPFPTGGTSDTLITSVSSLAFGNVVNGQTATLNVTVTNPPGNSDTIFLSEAVLAGMDTAAFSVTPFLPVNLAPGASQVIEVTFAPDAERDFGAATIAADGSAILTLLHNGANSALVLPLSGTGASSGGNDPISGLSLSTNSPVILGNVASFNATITAGTNVTYTWNFGDGTVTVGPAATTHTYAALGSYSVVVTATNPVNSQVAGATMQIIDPPPFARYINANGGTVFNGSGGKVWEIDNSFTGGATYSNTALAIAGTTDDLLYQTERFGAAGTPFSYNVAVDDGCYDVILHFAEIWFGVPGGGSTGGIGSRIFDVSIEGVVELDDYDIFAAVGAQTPDVHAFEVQVSDGSLDIGFTSVVENAKVSAIEILYDRPLCAVPTAINLDDVNQAPNGSLWGGVALVVVLVFVLGYVYVKRRGQMV